MAVVCIIPRLLERRIDYFSRVLGFVLSGLFRMMPAGLLRTSYTVRGD